MERERGERELEIARLRRAQLLQSIEARGEARPPAEEPNHLLQVPDEKRSPEEETRFRAPSAASDSGRAPSGFAERSRGSETERTPHRPIGRPIQSPNLRQLMALDPAERFDIQLLNTLPLRGLVEEASRDPRLLEALQARAQALMARVKAEVDDPLSAGAFLREQALLWYRTSSEDSEWTARMPDRWAGLFADSRVSGGRLHAWLNTRLLSVVEGTFRAGRIGGRIRRRLHPAREVESAMGRSAVQQIQAEAAQAMLDDLAARPRAGQDPFPLVRLSELAVRRQVQTVNDALSILFSSPGTGPFIVLHPNRYPDVEEVQIRPPSAGATGAALAFLLVCARSARRTVSRAGSSTPAGATRGDLAAGDESAMASEGHDGVSIWEDTSAQAADWVSVVESYRQEKKRLEAPPKDHRGRPAYEALRALVLSQGEFRRSFLVTRWRGRPAGLPLLAALLQKGTLAPEVATDHEYLEAELAALVGDDPADPTTPGSWKVPGWTITREGNPQEGLRYRAEAQARSAPDAPA